MVTQFYVKKTRPIQKHYGFRGRRREAATSPFNLDAMPNLFQQQRQHHHHQFLHHQFWREKHQLKSVPFGKSITKLISTNWIKNKSVKWQTKAKKKSCSQIPELTFMSSIATQVAQVGLTFSRHFVVWEWRLRQQHHGFRGRASTLSNFNAKQNQFHQRHQRHPQHHRQKHQQTHH